MQESLPYPQVTPEQISLWANDPVTVAYLTSLQQLLEDKRDDASDGSLVNSASADMTHGLIHQNMGHQQALQDALNFEGLLAEFNMIMTGEEDAA